MPFLSGLAAKCFDRARLHCRKSTLQPKKFDLVHQTPSPRERVRSGDKTTWVGGYYITFTETTYYPPTLSFS